MQFAASLIDAQLFVDAGDQLADAGLGVAALWQRVVALDACQALLQLRPGAGTPGQRATDRFHRRRRPSPTRELGPWSRSESPVIGRMDGAAAACRFGVHSRNGRRFVAMAGPR